LYEFAGGGRAFLALATAHHARCLADPELNHALSHDDQHPQHVERLAAYWGEVMGGPPVYSQECGDQSVAAGRSTPRSSVNVATQAASHVPLDGGPPPGQGPW